MKKSELVNIARLITKNGKVDKKTAGLILAKLKRRDLIVLARIMNRLINEQTIRVVSREELPATLKKEIEKKFSDKKVIFAKEDIGPGIKIIMNDTIMDLTIEGFIDSTMQSLKGQI